MEQRVNEGASSVQHLWSEGVEFVYYASPDTHGQIRTVVSAGFVSVTCL